ncbi:MAG: hypothetical protein Q4P36_04975 [Bowdeniella nasicola]|nr:hypothetical protein [Bowdeniella nasicola]
MLNHRPARGAAHQPPIGVRTDAPHRWRARLAATLTALLTVLIALAAPASAEPAPSRDEAPTPLILVGLGALRWSDVDPQTTPHLWGLMHAGDAHAGSIVVRALSSTTCPADAWLTVSAGRRAAGAPRGEACAAMPIASSPIRAEDWSDYLEAAATADYGAAPGTLGAMLADGAIRTAALGPGAVLALTQPDGSLADPDLATSAPLTASRALDATRAALDSGARFITVDAASGVDEEQRVYPAVPTAPAYDDAAAREIARTLDSHLGAVVQAAREAGGPVRVIAAGLSDRYRRPSLHVYAAGTITGPAASDSPTVATIASAATRQPALTQTTDVLPTIATHFGLPLPSSAVGSPIHSSGTHLSAELLAADQADYDLHLDRSRAAVPWFYPLYLFAVFALVSASALTLAEPLRRRLEPSIHRSLAFAALTCQAVPLGVYLVDRLPWWRLTSTTAFVLAGVALASAAVAALALSLTCLRRTCHVALPAGLLGATLWMVLVIDALLGAPLQRTALMGSFATVGGRFYGVNNTSFVLLTASGFITAALCAHLLSSRRARAAAFVVVGLITVVIDGAPSIGADFGGPPALVPAFTIGALLVAGVRLTWQRVLGVLLATGAVVAAISLADYARPAAERTHLGRLVQSVVDGEAGQLIYRKAAANLSILFSSYFTLAALVAVAFLAVLYLASRPGTAGAAPARSYRWVMDHQDGLPAAISVLRPTAIGLAVALALGFALNDSGIVIPAIGLGLALPALLSAIHLMAARDAASGTRDGQLEGSERR